jgi:hypothetical protein
MAANKAITHTNKQGLENEIHIKTQFYEALLKGEKPTLGNELIIERKAQHITQIGQIIDTLSRMRNAATGSAFLEDSVKIQFAIEHLES